MTRAGRWAVEYRNHDNGDEQGRNVLYTVPGRTKNCCRSLLLYHRRIHAEGLAGMVKARLRAAGQPDWDVRTTKLPPSVITDMAVWGD